MTKERKCPKCPFCGFRFRYKGIEPDGKKQYDTKQITPWRCENCNAVFELRNPENEKRGYIVARRPDRDFKQVGLNRHQKARMTRKKKSKNARSKR